MNTSKTQNLPDPEIHRCQREAVFEQPWHSRRIGNELPASRIRRREGCLALQ
jgi:hypothetical protein